MSFRHGLQHLDIKPHNLFLVSNHVKVGDFGLVDRLTDVEKTPANQRQGGVTPLYASPELLRGRVSRQCDQYSLAIVYQQLLTGTVPFWCQNLYELMVLHMTGEPNLTPLPADDRPMVARALTKRAADRYPSCSDFIQALVCGNSTGKPNRPPRAALVKKSLLELTPRIPKPVETPRSTSGSAATVPTSSAQVTKRPLAGAGVLPLPSEGSGTRPCSQGNDFQSFDLSSPSPAPACIVLPGYRFAHCIGQSPLGDLWNVEDEQQRPYRALCLPTFIEHDPVLIQRLQSLNHPLLPVTEVSWSPSGRLVLLTEHFEQTLRDRLQMCQKEGLPGIPREELLGYLRTAAEALDTLYVQHRLPHLGLNPRRLMLRNAVLGIVDYGLVPLIWPPTGQSAGSLNGRYAAPELFEEMERTGIAPGPAAAAALLEHAGSAADQFSLALIYAEMLSGIAPNMPRVSASRRSNSGQHRNGRRSDSGQSMKQGQPRLDFDLLPSCDRVILEKAFHDDPQQRFPSCTALIEALQQAAASAGQALTLLENLPPVIPFASLKGEPPAENTVLPPLNQFVLNLAIPKLLSSAQLRTIRGSQNGRCTVLPNDMWESKCPVQIFTGALALKVEGFRTEWNARVVEQKNNGYLFHIDLPPLNSTDDPDKNPVPVVAFQLDAQRPRLPRHVAEARMRVYPAGGNRFHVARLLPDLAPRLFDSMRSYLQAAPDQRSEDRWTCAQPLHVYPVKTDLELDEVLEGMSRNISFGGVSFRILEEPKTDQVYLHWHRSATVSAYAVLARIVRVQPMAGGGFEVAGCFYSFFRDDVPFSV
jgi:serine/threonine protein kinase